MSILELLQHIVNEPTPRLTPEGRFPKAAEEFVDACLMQGKRPRNSRWVLLISFVNHSCNSYFVEIPMDRASPKFVYKLGRLGKYVVILKSTVASPGRSFSVVDISISEFRPPLSLSFFHSPSCTLL